MLCVTEINELASLDRFRASWWKLLRQTSNATFFQSLEWLEVYWRHYARDQRLRVLVVGDLDEPLGILPLVWRQERRKVGKVRVLTYPLDDWGSYYGPIGPHPTETLLAGLQYLAKAKRDWELLELRWIPPAGHDAAETHDLMRLANFEPSVSQRDTTAIINMRGTWDEYLASRTSKWRNNFRRWHRRLHEAGEVRYERYRPTGAADDNRPHWDLFDECQRLASLSWQGSSTTGTTLTHEPVRLFIRDVHEVAARVGCLDTNLLFLNDRPLAFAYNYHFQGSVFGLRIGFDPQMHAFSPGNVMYTLAIEDSFARGDYLYDLGPGSLVPKRHLVTSVESILQYSYYRSLDIKAQLIKLNRRFQAWWDQDKNAGAEQDTAR